VPGVRAVLIGLAAFLVVLVVRLPARWVTPLLPDAARCAMASGTVWNGACDGLALSDGKTSPLVLQQVRWKLHPLPLLRARISSEIEMQSDWGSARASVDIGTGARLSISSLSASGTLDRRLLPVLPPGWNGAFDARDVSLSMRERTLLSLQGEASVRGLQDGKGTRFGDFRLQLAPAGDASAGELRDMGGPIDLQAKVRVTPDLNWTVDGMVGTRGGQLPEFQRQLQPLGVPDAAGRRPLSISGNF
jgi:hypothetical protein